MVAQSLIILPGQGPVWNMEEDRPTTFKLLSDQTQNSISVFEEMVPIGGGTPLHIHPSSDEVIHILSGAFTFKIGSQVTQVGADTWVFIPRGIAHAWKNTGSEAGRACFIFTPAENAKFFEEMRKFEVSILAIDPATIAEYGQRYGYQLMDFQPFG